MDTNENLMFLSEFKGEGGSRTHKVERCHADDGFSISDLTHKSEMFPPVFGSLVEDRILGAPGVLPATVPSCPTCRKTLWKVFHLAPIPLVIFFFEKC